MRKILIKNNNLIVLILLLTIFSCSLADRNKNKSNKEKKADIYYSHGTSKLISKEYTQALRYLLKAKALRPNDSKILNNLGMTYFFKKNYKRSRIHLERAISSNPKNSDARNNLASLYFKLGKLNKAKNEYETVLKDLLYSHQYRVLYNLALIDLEKGMRSTALDKLKLSISNKKDYCPAKYLLGQIQFSQKDFEKALESYKDASKGVCYGEAAPHFMQGLTFEKLGLLKSAREKYQFIIEKHPQSKYARLSRKRALRGRPYKNKDIKKVHFFENDSEDERKVIMASPNF